MPQSENSPSSTRYAHPIIRHFVQGWLYPDIITTMITQTTIDRLIAQLAPEGFTERNEAETRYPRRQLAAGVEVTRIAPSPTGFVHIGNVYTAMVCERIAHGSGGVFYVRIEDTDKAREVAGAREMIEQRLQDFGIIADESSTRGGVYGPYIQSEREQLYLGYAIDLLRRGRAYPCFATSDELDATYKQQQSAKVRPGYYGSYALWRDKDDAAINQALDAGKSFVLRFRSEGDHAQKIQFDDVIKGRVEMAQNDQDIPLIKTSGLPTYHLAHVVDDYLMGTTLVVRTDEWLPSVPLHMELSAALDLPVFRYAHPAPLSKLDNGNKRKLSKRKDPEADVAFWQAAGYPLEAIKAYLMGLANSNFEDWWKANPGSTVDDFPFSVSKLASSRGALIDMAKVRDYGKEVIAALPQSDYEAAIFSWAQQYAPDFYTVLSADAAYTSQVLAIERTGGQARKDVACWSDAPEQYGCMFEEWFTGAIVAARQELDSQISPDDQEAIIEGFMAVYDAADDRTVWFDKLKTVAGSAGFAVDMKAYRAEPSRYKGSVADAANVLRVRLTAKTRTPDLCTLMQVMGKQRITSRLSA
jgi:glutamyl/glutaminyl-tRNA synthetase